MTRSGEPTIKQQLAHMRELFHHNQLAHEFQVHLLRRILRKVGKMAGEIERVLEEVAEIKGKVTSMAALLAKLAQLIRDNAGNPAVLNQIADDLDASSKEAQAAIDANDPDKPPVI